MLLKEKVMWTLPYVFSQIFAVLAYLMMVLTLYTRKKILILIFTLIDCIMFAMQYLLLKAYVGMAINLVAMVRCAWFYIEEKCGKSKNIFSLLLFLVLTAVASIFGFDTWVETFALLAGLLFTYAIWQNSIILYRFLVLFCSCLWIAYNTIHMSIFGVVGESIVVLANIFSISIYFYKLKKQKQKIFDTV